MQNPTGKNIYTPFTVGEFTVLCEVVFLMPPDKKQTLLLMTGDAISFQCFLESCLLSKAQMLENLPTFLSLFPFWELKQSCCFFFYVSSSSHGSCNSWTLVHKNKLTPTDMKVASIKSVVIYSNHDS